MKCKPDTHIIIDDESTDEATVEAKHQPKSDEKDESKEEATDIKSTFEIKENILIRQVQPKTETVIGQTANLVEVLDIIRSSGNGRVICRVKTSCVAMDAWIPYEQLKQNDPQKLIRYFETRIDWPHKRQ